MKKLQVMPENSNMFLGLNREKIEKLIRITGLYLAINHMLVAVAVPLYNIIVPTMRGMEYTIGLFFLAEIGLLFLVIRKSSPSPRMDCEKVIKDFFTKDQILLSLLPLLHFVSIVVNTVLDGQVRYTVNSKYLFDILVNVFVTYPLGRYYVHHKFPNKLEIFLHIVITAVTVYMVYVLITVFSGETIKTFFRGTIGMQKLDFGETYEYHLQVNSHHNTTGAFAASFMLICLCFSVIKKGFLRILYLLESFVHSIVLVLANSRSNFISGAVFLSVYLGLILYFVLKHKLNKVALKKKKWIQWIFSILAVVGSFYVMCALRGSVFEIYQKCTGEFASPKENVLVESASEAESEQDEKVEARDLDVTNLMSRDLIWGYALQAMISDNRTLFFGVTPPGTYIAIGDIGGPQYYTYSHNQILEIGLGIGLPAMVIFAIWLIILANRCVIIGFAEETRLSLQQKLVPLLVLYLVMFNMVEAILIFGNSFIGGLFMFSSAWCFETVRSSKVNSKMFRIRTDMVKNMPARKKQTQIEKSDIIKENERNLTETGDNNSNVSADAESINQ